MISVPWMYLLGGIKMNFDNVKLRYIHKNGRDVLQGYLPNEPEDSLNKTLGWQPEYHNDPIRAAVIYMNVWMGLNQSTLWDTYDQCDAGVSISRSRRDSL